MSKVVADISMSLDGYVTGPNPDLQHGLGQGGNFAICLPTACSAPATAWAAC